MVVGIVLCERRLVFHQSEALSAVTRGMTRR